MKQKIKIRIGDIYGIYEQHEGGHHPYLVIAISDRHIYTTQGSSIKLLSNWTIIKNNRRSNYFKEHNQKYYEIKFYNENVNLKYKTVFGTEQFNWDQKIIEKKHIGRIEYKDYRSINKLIYKNIKNSKIVIDHKDSHKSITTANFLLLLKKCLKKYDDLNILI